MTTLLRIMLITISIITFIYIVINIRKARVKLTALFFWLLFGMFLIFLSVFPQIAEIGTKITGFYAPINFILVLIIFLVLYKLFSLTLHLSQLQQKVEELTQRLALDAYDQEHQLDKANVPAKKLQNACDGAQNAQNASNSAQNTAQVDALGSTQNFDAKNNAPLSEDA